jgi:hypothetical protein
MLLLRVYPLARPPSRVSGQLYVLAKVARFAVLAKRLRRPVTPRPTGLKISRLRKHVVFMAILTLCFERVRPRKATWRIA